MGFELRVTKRDLAKEHVVTNEEMKLFHINQRFT